MRTYYRLLPNPAELLDRNVRLPSSYSSSSGQELMLRDLMFPDPESLDRVLHADYTAETMLPSLLIDSFGLLVSTPDFFQRILGLTSQRISSLEVHTTGGAELRMLNLPAVNCMDCQKSRIRY